MIRGKVYRLITKEGSCKECGSLVKPEVTRFPFDEPLGIFLGEAPSGFLEFRFSGQKVGAVNGGIYEEVEANISIEVSDNPAN